MDNPYCEQMAGQIYSAELQLNKAGLWSCCCLFIVCYCSHCLSVRSLFCFAVLCVLSGFEIILLGKKELVALLLLCSECHVAVIILGLLIALPWFGL